MNMELLVLHEAEGLEENPAHSATLLTTNPIWPDRIETGPPMLESSDYIPKLWNGLQKLYI
jgi:hypothetical protein